MAEKTEFDDLDDDEVDLTGDPDPETVFDDEDLEEGDTPPVEEEGEKEPDMDDEKPAPKAKKEPAKAKKEPAKAKKEPAKAKKEPAKAPTKARKAPESTKRVPARASKDKVVLKIIYKDSDVLKQGKDSLYPFASVLKKAQEVSESAYTRLNNYKYRGILGLVELYGYLWVSVKNDPAFPEGLSVNVKFLKR